MNNFKRNCLIIFASVCLLVLILLSVSARADEIEWHPAIYGTFRSSTGSGYENPAFGFLGEFQARYEWAEVKINGSYNWQKKKGASNGNTYGIGGQLRGYFYDGLYGLGAIQWSGYSSEFSTHGPWQKSGTNFGIGAGWSNPDLDIYLTYFFQENGSPNKVSYMPVNLRIRLWKWLWAMTEFGPEWFEQSEDNRTSFFCNFGVGVRW